MEPYDTSNRLGTYCRLFPPNDDAPDDAASGRLEHLARLMASDDPSIPVADMKPGHIPAAYTYFGQFIDHDLTRDVSDVPNPGNTIDPTHTTNERRSFLNLDSVYGDGPTAANIGTLYEDNTFFRLGAALSNGRSFDVPLGGECQPLTADTRNVENAIVRQIHAMFLQLHNLVAQELIASMPAPQAFVEARERVRHQFQWLVWNDFLPQLCNTETIKEVRRGRGRLIDWKGCTFSIPAEFAQAAFRLGHSMVRDGYRLGQGEHFNLRDIFGGSASRGALPTKLAVNWNEFCAVSGNPQFARPIGTTVVKDLYHLPIPSIQVFVAALARSGATDQILPLRTLHRGAASCLASGEAAIAYLLGHKPTCPVLRKPSDNYQPHRNPFDRLNDAGLCEATPLWYYVLMEAELNEAGNRLGMLGGSIVAGTIEGALWSNPDSYAHKGSKWRRHKWKARDGTLIEIEKLYDVARVVGLA